MRRLLLVFICLCFWMPFAHAQTSIGFDDPGDNSTILDYRLPTWGYKIWDANFGLNGGGHDASYGGEKTIRNNFNSNLGTNFRYYNESEKCTRTISGSMGFAYQRSHSGYEDQVRSGHSFDANYDIGLQAHRYLAEGPFSLRAQVRDFHRYNEDASHLETSGEITDRENYNRSHGNDFKFGVGWGRVRDVAPLIRAHRISERLVDLGHDRLSSQQIQQMAEVIAKEYGYRVVFDRELRHFWDDLLAPVLGDSTKLSAYEIFYLADALKEEIGDRNQGFSVAALWSYSGIRTSNSSYHAHNRSRSPMVEAIWSHNLTMEHQFFVYSQWQFNIQNQGSQDRETGRLQLSLGHLWNLADRHLWQTRFDYDNSSVIDPESRTRSANFHSTWTMYIEDSLSLRAGANTRYYWHRGSPGDPQFITHGWDWGYSLRMVYHLDSILF